MTWVSRYIDEDPATLASQGISLVSAAAAKLHRALAEVATKREAKKGEKKNEKIRKALSGHPSRKRLQDDSVESESARPNKTPRLGKKISILIRHVGPQASEANDQRRVDMTKDAQDESGLSPEEKLVMQDLCESYFAYDILPRIQDQEGDHIGTNSRSEIGNTERGHSSDPKVMSNRNDAVFRSYFPDSPTDSRSHTSHNDSDTTLFHGKKVKVTNTG